MSEEITMKKSTYQQMLVAFVAVLVIASFAVGYMVGGGSSSPTGSVVQQPIPQAQQPQQQAPAGRVQLSTDGDPELGNANAPVTVIEFSDFQCPFCQRAFADAVAGIKQDYVASGKVRFVYRDFPLESIHPQAAPAALAAECANEQGKFWEYHDVLFINQGSLSDASYKQWAADLGLDATQFNSCYDSQKYAGEVQKDLQDGVSAGVSGTPTFFIGTPSAGYVKLVGAQPYANVQSVIESELA